MSLYTAETVVIFPIRTGIATPSDSPVVTPVIIVFIVVVVVLRTAHRPPRRFIYETTKCPSCAR